jgi:cytochrome c1
MKETEKETIDVVSYLRKLDAEKDAEVLNYLFLISIN